MTVAPAACSLCAPLVGPVYWQDARARVLDVQDPDYPGYLRVVWRAHVGEMTDLPDDDRRHCMHIVWACETVLRQALKPDKVNLASFGNQVPHLHWHVIPRFRDDAHFPEPVWGIRQRTRAPQPSAPEVLVAGLQTLLGSGLAL